MNQLRVLVVDDSSDCRVMAGMALRRLNVRHEFDEADRSECARFLLSDRKYDLVILDNHLPGAKGTEVVDWMRKRGMTTPVIMISSFSPRWEVEDYLRDGRIQGFVEKYGRMAKFRHALSKELAKIFGHSSTSD